MKRFENAQQSSSTSVQLLETPDLVTDRTATGDSGSTQFSKSIYSLARWEIQLMFPSFWFYNIGEEEGKKRVEPEDIIQFQNLFIKVNMRILFRQQDCNIGQGPPTWTGTYMLHAARRTGDQGQGKLEEKEKEVEQHLRAMSKCFQCLSLKDVTLTNETSNGNWITLHGFTCKCFSSAVIKHLPLLSK